MNGIDNILEEIRENSDNTVRDIISKANTEADDILKKADIEIEKSCKSLKSDCELECKNIIERANSTANLIKKRAILESKQKIISETINEARNRLLSLDDDEYFKLVIKMIEKHSSEEKGYIFFNKKDIERLPPNFSEEIFKLSKGTLMLGDTPVDIDGGFILVYNNIEENCSFKAIFDDNIELLQDKVKKWLFDEGV